MYRRNYIWNVITETRGSCGNIFTVNKFHEETRVNNHPAENEQFILTQHRGSAAIKQNLNISNVKTFPLHFYTCLSNTWWQLQFTVVKRKILSLILNYMFVICFSSTARHGFCIVVMFYFKIFLFLFCNFWFVHLSVSFPLVIFYRCLFCLHHLCSPPVSSSQSHCGRLLCSVISPSLVLPSAFPVFSFGLSSITVDLFVLALLDCSMACSFFGIMFLAGSFMFLTSQNTDLDFAFLALPLSVFHLGHFPLKCFWGAFYKVTVLLLFDSSLHNHRVSCDCN